MESYSTLVDIGVASIFLICAMIGYKKGFIMSILGFVPFIGAFFLTGFITPIIASFLRKTPIYGGFVGGLEEKFAFVEDISLFDSKGVLEFIEGLQVPDFLKEVLVVNNNPVVHDLLGVENLVAYIVGFLATLCVNILSYVIVFFCILMITNIFMRGLNIVSRLPILNSFNRIIGMLIGIFKGLVFVWLFGVVLFYFQCNGQFLELADGIENSKIAKWFYDNNIILKFILNIFN